MPSTATSPHAQTLRAVVLAAVASGTATLAHAAGGGHLVSGTAVVVTTLLLTGACLPLVRREMTVARAGVLLVVLQVAAHVAHGITALAAGPGGHAHGSAAGGHVATHTAHGIRPLGRIEVGDLGAAASPAGSSAGSTAASASTASAAGLADLLPGPGMLVAHVLAAIAVGVLLTRGEQSWAVACTLVAALAAGLGAAVSRLVAALTGGSLVNALELLLASTVDAERDRTARRLARLARLVRHDVWSARTPVRRGPPAFLLH
ncbi:hypothetical protein GCM10023258_07110 [Terrabacter aeriphilus]|uniref:Integral membrane protein n=1 Tax=Terrabacter aeriphilus TaxID=515662 RepID=A0ABP9J5J1_9MICO